MNELVNQNVVNLFGNLVEVAKCRDARMCIDKEWTVYAWNKFGWLKLEKKQTSTIYHWII